MFYVIVLFNLFSSWVNPLLPGIPFLYPLKTSESHRFAYVFKVHKKETPGSGGLIKGKLVYFE